MTTAPDRFDVLAGQLRAFIRDVGGPLATREVARVLRETHASGAEAMRRRAVETCRVRSGSAEAAMLKASDRRQKNVLGHRSSEAASCADAIAAIELEEGRR